MQYKKFTILKNNVQVVKENLIKRSNARETECDISN